MNITLILSFIEGIIAKWVSGFDDVATQTPLVNALTRTHFGRLAFIIGMLLALTVILIFASSLSLLVEYIPYKKYLISLVFILLAAGIHYDLLFKPSKQPTKRKINKVKKITKKRFIKLLLIGFIVFFTTAIDDLLIYTPIIAGSSSRFFALAGVFTGGLIEAIGIFFFSHQISKIKYKKEISETVLVLFALFNLI